VMYIGVSVVLHLALDTLGHSAYKSSLVLVLTMVLYRISALQQD